MKLTNLTIKHPSSQAKKDLPVYLDDSLSGRALACESLEPGTNSRLFYSIETCRCSVSDDLEQIHQRIYAAQRSALSYTLTRVICGKDVAQFLAAQQSLPLEIKD